MEILSLILLYFLVVISFSIFYFVINVKWIVKIVRSICSVRNQGGYMRFTQACINIILWSLFIFIVIYYILNHEKVDRIDLILTVIVGWLGMIIGRFFGESAMESLKSGYRTGYRQIRENQKKLISWLKKSQDILKRVEESGKK